MNTELVTIVTAIIGAVCGVFGMVLSLFNTSYQVNRNKVRLKVLPIFVFNMPSIDFGIKVINLSEFPVVVTGIALAIKTGESAWLLSDVGIDHPSKLPLKLEPRNSYTKFFNCSILGKSQKQIKYAFVTTECGKTIKGNSGALKQIVKEAKKRFSKY